MSKSLIIFNAMEPKKKRIVGLDSGVFHQWCLHNTTAYPIHFLIAPRHIVPFDSGCSHAWHRRKIARYFDEIEVSDQREAVLNAFQYYFALIAYSDFVKISFNVISWWVAFSIYSLNSSDFLPNLGISTSLHTLVAWKSIYRLLECHTLASFSSFWALFRNRFGTTNNGSSDCFSWLFFSCSHQPLYFCWFSSSLLLLVLVRNEHRWFYLRFSHIWCSAVVQSAPAIRESFRWFAWNNLLHVCPSSANVQKIISASFVHRWSSYRSTIATSTLTNRCPWPISGYDHCRKEF